MHLEKEVKILDVNVLELQSLLNNIGAKFHGKKEQYLYTYDVPTIYYRFLEISALLHSNTKLIYLTNLKRLKLLLEEAEGFISTEVKKELCARYGIDSILDITDMDRGQIFDFVEDETLNEAMKDCMINPNKWVRLRKSNDKVELTVKHILGSVKDEDGFQRVIENEISTSSFEETNALLEALGLVKRNYQEKIRYSYSYKDASIEIDVWPQIKPYLEIECEDIALIEEIILRLGIGGHEVVSCNTEELYRRIGLDIKSMPELRF
ncbi:MAG: CYTH domain-containing protein [Clostridia bacterium]|nr:CYTH domain-containing protein [Clostridia bacterium]